MIMNHKQQYDCFLASLRWYIKDGGFGTKAHIGKNSGVSGSFIGQISKPDATKKAKPEVQSEIAKFLCGSFDKMVTHGASLLGLVVEKSKEYNPEFDTRLKRIEAKLNHPTTLEEAKNAKNADHHNKINEFQDQDTAMDITSKLVELERLDPAILSKINSMVQLELDVLKVKKGVARKSMLGEENQVS